MANSVDPDQTALIGAVCSGSTVFASILSSSVMLGNYLQQTTSADDIFRCIFFLALLGLMFACWELFHDFFRLLKMNFVKNSFRNTNRVSNNLDPNPAQRFVGPGLQVIKLEYNLKLKIKLNDWLLAETCPGQPIIALYFELENELEFYNLKA